MKILFLVNHDVVIYNFRLELVERLIEEGHQVIISSPYGERISDLVKLGCKYYPIEISRHGVNPFTDLRLYNTYLNLVRTVSPNIVFSYTIKPNIYGASACAALGVPYVVNITGLGSATEKRGIMQTLILLMYRFSLRKVKRVFCQNTEILAFFLKHSIAVDRLSLLPGSGVNLSHFSILPYPSDTFTAFAFISRIMKDKGIDYYLRAAERIRERYPNTLFHVCGFCEERYEEKLKEYEKRGIIKYHGMVRDVREVLAQVHCTVHPTYYPEGISNVLLESAACGRPVITTDRSGCREVVEDGVTGFLVPVKDEERLYCAMERFVLSDPVIKRQMGLNGRLKVEQEFDRNIIVSAYLAELPLDNDIVHN